MGNNVLGDSSFTGWTTSTTSKDIVGVVTIENTTEATFCVPGVYNWTVPTGLTSINAVLIGGGANGNGSTLGGQGGELCYFNGLPVTEGSTLKIAVGNGGESTSANSAWGEPSVIFDKSVAVTNANFNVITPGYTDYTTSTSWSPSMATSFSYSAVVISGGGSGGASAGAGGGGGGAGGTTAWLNNFYPFEKSGGITVTVGLGGAGVTPGNNGNNGGTSEIIYATDNSQIISVPGGGGGVIAINGGAGGTTTTPTGATSYYLGGIGGPGTYAGGGGGGAGSFVSAGGAGGTGRNNVTGNGTAGIAATAGGAGGGGGGAGYTISSLSWGGGGGAGVSLTFSSAAATGGTAGTWTTPSGPNTFAGGGQGSSAGAPASAASGSGGRGAIYGGGSGGFPGGNTSSNGGNGAIRIIWPGVTRAFPPSSSTASATPSYTTVTYWITVNSAITLNLTVGMPILFDQAIGPLAANTIYTVTTASANFSNASTFYYFQVADSRGRTSTLPAPTNISTANVNLYYPSNISRGGGSSGTYASIRGGVTGTSAANLGGTPTTVGGGGAGGYTAIGGGSGAASTGGGGGGGSLTANFNGAGGVGIYGSIGVNGQSTTSGGTGGSFGSPAAGNNGGRFGGGGGSTGTGAGGAVRITWGGNTFPNNAIPTANTIVTNGSITSSPSIIPANTLVNAVSGPTGNTYATVTLNNNPTATGKAEFTVAGLIASPPTGINSSTKSFAITTTNSDGTKASAQPTNNTQSRIDNTNDASQEPDLKSNAMPDNNNNSKRSDQNLSTTDAVINRIGWTG